MNRSAPYLCLATTVFFWGTQYWAIEIAAPYSPPIVITALRTVPAAITLVAAALLLRSRFPGRRLAWSIFVTGVIGVALTLGGITEGAARRGAETPPCSSTRPHSSSSCSGGCSAACRFRGL